MQIGSFKPNNGTLFGSISTASLHLPRLGLKPVQSNHERAPSFEVMALNPARRWVQIGALWEATANSTGETFYQGQVDDPSFNAPLPIALFGDGEAGFNVAWNRRRKREEDNFNDAEGGPDESGGDPFGAEPGNDPAPRRARRSRKADSFEGNADDSGNLTERQGIDDEIPF
ncbi:MULTISPECIES: DUF736 domain-containing protein [Sphingobium]|jgi:uncharacterized protein (DUF736 family)|uniref:DUF736 domain-containing protein n=1 Tax=Sphingobium TaxID=165695 RepID=UPI0010F9F97F|nr:DUF736 domain-containing protein [Sphingobium sp. RSMS]UXC92933.1 DUF736 domain-containing protein [Sphingobium sp. RSMS]